MYTAVAKDGTVLCGKIEDDMVLGTTVGKLLTEHGRVLFDMYDLDQKIGIPYGQMRGFLLPNVESHPSHTESDK